MKLKKAMQFAELSLLQGADWTTEVVEEIKDMLRYDGAFVNVSNPTYLGIVAFPMWKTKEGDLYGKITMGRWHSGFGVKIKRTIDEPAWSDDMMCNPSQWITYRKDNDSDLVQFTFREYLLAKTSEVLRKECRIRVGREKCRACGSPENTHMKRCPERIDYSE